MSKLDYSLPLFNLNLEMQLETIEIHVLSQSISMKNNVGKLSKNIHKRFNFKERNKIITFN